ncbi:MAG: hypothetical protein IJ705_04340 [Oscillospiraceae bacterium]|nr:hypothetical protein [Oscillospiraceae bacterium]
MRQISISDITIRQPENEGGFALSFREKIELAKLLDRLGVSVIETGPIVNRRTDSLLIKSIASAVKSGAVAVPLFLTEGADAETVWNALKEAAHPRLQVVAPVSTVQMEYLCRLKPEAVVERIRVLVAAAKALCPEVEFVAEDAGRSESDFLKTAIDAAIGAGAGIVTVCDTAGTLLPDELYDSIRAARADIPPQVCLGVRCSNELAVANAAAMAAIRAGADEVKTSACGGFTTTLDKLVHILKLRGGDYGVSCAVRDTELLRGIAQIRRLCEGRRGKSGVLDSAVHAGQSELSLSVHDDLSAVVKAAEKLGYELSEEDGVKVYEAFTRIASKKEAVSARELDAIVASAALQVPPTYRVESYVINSGNTITATSHIRMKKGEQLIDGLAVGDGPIDASFLAIEQIVGCHYELDDFQIQAVTEGREAMGETVIRLRAGGKLYSGRGISTDVISSSIRAYVNAVNKIVYEEGE